MGIIELIKEALPIFKKIKESVERKEMFKDLGTDVLNLEHDEGELLEQLTILFSEENIMKIARENKSNRYTFIDSIEEELVNFFSEKETHSEERKKYIDVYLDSLKKQLEEKFPEH